MFSKSLASSRVVVQWLFCLMVALLLSGCSNSRQLISNYQPTLGSDVCGYAGTAGTAMAGPVGGIGAYLACVIATSQYRGSGEIYEKTGSGIVVVVTDHGRVGAGAIISPEGHVLTDEGVIADAKDIRILFLADVKQQDEPRVSYVAEKISFNPRHGLALLKLSQPPQNLTVLELASSGELQSGQTIHTMGHSEAGRESWIYFEGLVRDITGNFMWTNPVSSVTYHTDVAVQTQTPINPGNSGAFLFDDEGKLAGMFVSSNPADDRINYAIPTKVFADFVIGQ